MTTTTLERPITTTGTRTAEPRPNFAPAPRSRVELGPWFEKFYRDAAGDISRVPWADGAANPAFVAWLNAAAPCLVRPGGRVAVVGCGLGHDAVELVNRGYDVTAFDIAPTAVEWAKRLHPAHEDRFVVADACAPPSRLRHRFDLVVEAFTIQSAPLAFREDLVKGMAELLGPRGVLLAICRGRANDAPVNGFDAPPYPLTVGELVGLMRGAGLAPLSDVDDFEDDGDPPVRRLRGCFKRA